MTNFENLNLAHGSGGELTNQLLDQGVFTILSNDFLQKKHDGAILDLSGKTAFTTDSFVVSPLFFPGGNIGDLAVNGTVNDLAMCGAKAKYLSLSFIIEEGLPVKVLTQILKSIKKAAEKANVLVVTGDTKIVEKGKGDRIFINTSGIGVVHPKACIDAGNVRENDVLVISGPVANHGMAILSKREGFEFDSEIKSDTCSLKKQVSELLDEFGPDIHLLRDPTRGGVATVLNEIARYTELGIAVNEAGFAIEKPVAAACEMLGIDPLYVANEGIFIAWVANTIHQAVLKKLRQCNQQAAVIGTMTSAHPKQVVMKSSIGGRRIVSMPSGEQLPRIC